MRVLKNVNHPILGSLKLGLLDENDSEDLTREISNLLIACATDLAESKGGHVPDEVVQNRILKYYTTVDSIKKVAVANTSRFVLSHDSNIVGTVLVANTPGVLMPEYTHGSHTVAGLLANEWTRNKHSIFNLAVNKKYRRNKLAWIILDGIAEQRVGLLTGDGFYLRSEPPEHDIWIHLGFSHIRQLDEYLEHPIVTPASADLTRFNAKYRCNCFYADERFNNPATKIKYFGFIRQFSTE